MSDIFEIDAIERLAADILGLLGSGGAAVLATERFEPFNPTLPWLHFARHSGEIVALAWGDPLTRLGMLGRTVSLGRRLQWGGLSGAYLLTESFGPVSPRLQRIIQSCSNEIAGPIRYAAVEDLRHADDGSLGPVTTRILETPLTIGVELRGVTAKLHCGARIFFDAIQLSGCGRRLRSRSWKVNGEGIVMTVEELMVGATQSMAAVLASEVHVTIDIGAFQMNLGELLGLRPGAQVELPCPSPLRGIIKAEGAALGLVTLTWSKDSLMATLEEVSCFKGIEKNVRKLGNDESKGAITEGVFSMKRLGDVHTSDRTLEGV